MPRRFSQIDTVIRDAEAAADKQIDPLLVLQMLLKLTISSEADPYLLMGMLLEATAETIVQRIPAEKRGEVSIDVMRLLRDRLRERGLI
jgi:hypothetical protein